MAIMAHAGKLVAEVELMSDADDIFHTWAGKKAHHATNWCPEMLRKVELHEGELGVHGSIEAWTYVLDEKEETYKEKVSIDEENKTVHLTALEGDCLEIYKSYIAIFEFIHKGETSFVKVTSEYEKRNEEVPPPNKYMEFLVDLIKTLDAKLYK